MTIKKYLTDRSTSGTVTVSEIITGDKPVVRLVETWFHPQGGGQKADRGVIGSARILHVAHNAGEVDHYVDRTDSLSVGKSYLFNIDVEGRRFNSAYHTAGHLIASIIEDQFPSLRAVSGHQWPGEGRVEFEGEIEDTEAVRSPLEREITHVLFSKQPVYVIGDPYTDRAIQIGKYKAIPCGGTHVTTTDQIGSIKIVGLKKKSCRLRVSYTVMT
ncbi:MAG: alanyl-tRNA editing protein [Nitrospira sp. WS110]|nr:alanyl-tRNA editing protein [Nitrospira sp. WS110]